MILYLEGRVGLEGGGAGRASEEMLAHGGGIGRDPVP